MGMAQQDSEEEAEAYLFNTDGLPPRRREEQTASSLSGTRRHSRSRSGSRRDGKPDCPPSPNSVLPPPIRPGLAPEIRPTDGNMRDTAAPGGEMHVASGELQLVPAPPGPKVELRQGALGILLWFFFSSFSLADLWDASDDEGERS